MTAKGKQWKLETLVISEIGSHRELQVRVEGTKVPQVIKIKQALQNGENLPPIKVARVGANLYVVDGHHRLEAHRAAKRVTISADVARMSLPEAKDEARRANANHGKHLTRKDKHAIWSAFVAEGKHLTEWGAARPAADIWRDLDRIWTRKTIRKHLRALNVELDLDDQNDPTWEPGEDEEEAPDEAALIKQVEDEVSHAAQEGLGLFLRNYNRLPSNERARLLDQAETLVRALKNGQDLEEVPGPLDI